MEGIQAKKTWKKNPKSIRYNTKHSLFNRNITFDKTLYITIL